MWLNDKVYELETKSNSELNENSVLKVIVNGKDSGITLDSLVTFIEKNFNNLKFRGFSILQEIEEDSSGKFKTLNIENKEYSISLQDSESGSIYNISDIHNHWIQRDDREIPDKSIDDLLSKIINSQKEVSPDNGNTKEEGQKPGAGTPRPALLPTYVSSSYEDQKKYLMKRGYEEKLFPNTEFKNFRVLYKNQDFKIVEIKEDGDFDILNVDPSGEFSDSSKDNYLFDKNKLEFKKIVSA